MEFNKQNKLTNKKQQTCGDREQTASCQRGGELGGLGKKGEGIKPKKKKRKKEKEKTFLDIDNSMVITRGKRAWGGSRRPGKEGINGDGRRLDLNTQYNIQMMYYGTVHLTRI